MRRILLVGGDMVAIAVSIVLAAVVRLAPHDMKWAGYLQDHMYAFSVAGIIFLIVLYASGMYERQALVHKENAWVTPAIASGIGLVIMIVLFFAHSDFAIGRGVLLLAGLFVFVGTWTVRMMYRIAVGFGFLSRNALIVGGGEAAHRILELLHNTEDAGFRIFGVVTDDEEEQGTFLEGVPVLGTLPQLRDFVDVYEIETILVASALSEEPLLLRKLRPLRYSGIELTDYVGLYEEMAQEIPLDHIDDEWLMHAAMNSSVMHIRKIKRMMDMTVALVGLIVSAPISILAALLVKLDSPGPVLYRQRRSGLEGDTYTVLKFRTMKKDAEVQSGAVWAGKVDARVTRSGEFMRKWRVDEIPQLVNVLKGEMSLVGPRPERPEFVETLSENIPFYQERLMVPPGITGWAQVKYPYAASMEASRRKLQYDLYYIKHMRFLLDVQILLRTFRTILIGIRHSSDEEHDEVDEDPTADHGLTVLGGEGSSDGSGEEVHSA